MSMLKKTTMKDQIYALIKGRIFDQTYKQGAKINMLELAQELGVSNSPIREALSLLESEGLVVFTPNAGPKVVTIDEKLFEEIQETARILLLGCYEQCVERHLVDDLIETTETYLQRQRALEYDLRPESEAEFARLAMEFDVCVLKVLGNKTLEQLYSAFFNLMLLVVLYDHVHADTSRSEYIQEHQDIVDAVKRGDHDEVRRRIYRHFGRQMVSKSESNK